MCYVEDIYHSECGHWSAEPRVYHRCAAAAAIPGCVTACFDRKTAGASSEDSLCKRCQLDLANIAQKQGTWLSIFDEKDGVGMTKLRVVIRPRTGTNEDKTSAAGPALEFEKNTSPDHSRPYSDIRKGKKRADDVLSVD